MIRTAAALGLALLLAPSPACQEAGTLRMTVFELALHGLAVVLQTPSGAVYVVDTGKKEDGEDAGKHTLAPFLKARGVRNIAGILVSHPHRDHYEGAAYLLKHFRVKSFLDGGADGPLVDADYMRLKALAREKGAEYRAVRAGETLTWDDTLEVTVLAPPKEGVESPDKDRLNDNSVVLRVRHGKNVFLLPGDLEAAGGDNLVSRVAPETLRSTVLVAPHHGFFDVRRFAEIVKPEIVVVSCLPEYSDRKPRSPGKQAADLFGAVGARVYVTSRDGTVEITSDGATCAVKSARERK